MQKLTIQNVLILFNLIKKQMSERSKETGYSSSFCRLLFAIDNVRKRKKCVYQKDLEEKFHLSKSGLSELLLGLENNGLIERVASTTDSRYKEIKVSLKGEEAIKTIHKNELIIEEIIRENICEEDYEIFTRTITKMQENLGGMKNEN